jgi:hypothetical protein
VNILPDNQLLDKYLYQIVIFTGIRRNAGTKSKVNYKIPSFLQLLKYCFRFISLYRVIMVKHTFELCQIFIDRFYNVVRLIHLSSLYQGNIIPSLAVQFCNLIIDHWDFSLRCVFGTIIPVKDHRLRGFSNM